MASAVPKNRLDKVKLILCQLTWQELGELSSYIYGLRKVAEGNHAKKKIAVKKTPV